MLTGVCNTWEPFIHAEVVRDFSRSEEVSSYPWGFLEPLKKIPNFLKSLKIALHLETHTRARTQGPQ